MATASTATPVACSIPCGGLLSTPSMPFATTLARCARTLLRTVVCVYLIIFMPQAYMRPSSPVITFVATAAILGVVFVYLQRRRRRARMLDGKADEDVHACELYDLHPAGRQAEAV